MIRPAVVDDASPIGHVHVESWRSTYRGLIPDTVLDNLSAEQRANFWREVIERPEKQSVIVATDGRGHVIGFVSGGLEREHNPVYTAELYALYLLKEQQGYGYGKALFETIAEKFCEQHHTAMLLWVLSTNPTRGFYKKMGGRYLKAKLIDLGGKTLTEVAYGWDNLADLAK